MINTNQLNAAGEALKALGEPALLGFWPADHLRLADTFTLRLELPGTSGVQGRGATAAEAYSDALREREAAVHRMEREARIRELGEAALVGEQPRKAA